MSIKEISSKEIIESLSQKKRAVNQVVVFFISFIVWAIYLSDLDYLNMHLGIQAILSFSLFLAAIADVRYSNSKILQVIGLTFIAPALIYWNAPVLEYKFVGTEQYTLTLQEEDFRVDSLNPENKNGRKYVTIFGEEYQGFGFTTAEKYAGKELTYTVLPISKRIYSIE